MSTPTVRQNVVALTQEEQGALTAILKSYDRAGFYLAYYAMTGNSEALLQGRRAIGTWASRQIQLPQFRRLC